ncbi:MAG: cbb3-type cytochrome c oxidase subunit 3 [Hyphomonadaceae bacterium]
MSYEQASHLAQTWGLVLLAACFAGAVIYALWPGNRDKFKRAARSPLEEGDDDGR